MYENGGLLIKQIELEQNGLFKNCNITSSLLTQILRTGSRNGLLRFCMLVDDLIFGGILNKNRFVCHTTCFNLTVLKTLGC